jgi:hypothetical protein
MWEMTSGIFSTAVPVTIVHQILLRQTDLQQIVQAAARAVLPQEAVAREAVHRQEDFKLL